MKLSSLARCSALMIVGTMAVACTMKEQETPPLAGPSEFGKSVDVSVSPDVLKQDGASQSVITVTVRGPNGQPLANEPLRAEISVGGVVTAFGKLSATNLRTGNDGRAILTYTAPLGPPFVLQESTIVNIDVTPVGTDFGNATPRSASLRLVAIGVVVPPLEPGELDANFTFSPTAPVVDQTIFFDASSSKTPANNQIVSYSWDFGNGDTGGGRTTTHSYSQTGTFVVRLTIADALGRSNSESVSLAIGAPSPATPRFTFSPTAPAPRQQVNFNASLSTPGPNRRIVSYSWDFGDGKPAQSGVQTSHTFDVEGMFTVTLTITDDTGREYVASQTVPIKIPT
jgi:PKD repeat protein